MDKPSMSATMGGGKHRLTIRAVARTIREHGMLQGGEKVLVGVSGGADSVALLHVLLELKSVFNLDLELAHLNHDLRGDESRRDADFVALLAKRSALALHTERIDDDRLHNRRGLSLEESARRVRYEFLKRTATVAGCARIALGHHADDSAELILMNVLRGSGPAGLRGIPPVREGYVVRPLIRLARSDILAYLQARGHTWVEDASNKDTRFARNRIRHHLLPMLVDRYNPSVRSGLNRLGSIMADENEWIESLLTPFFEQCVQLTADGGIRLSATEIRRLHTAVQRRMILDILHRLRDGSGRLGLIHVEAVRRVIADGRTGGGLNLPGGVRVLHQGNAVLFFRTPPKEGRPPAVAPGPEACAYEYTIFREGVAPLELEVGEIGARLRFSPGPTPGRSDFRRHDPWIGYCDPTRITLPLVVRNVRPGDRFRPLGLAGTKKVNKCFIDCRIPREQRRRYPVVTDRDRILWIAGLRVDDRCKVDESTRNVLKIELLLA